MAPRRSCSSARALPSTATVPADLNGTWTDSLGNVSGSHNSHCIAYWGDGRAGRNGKGQCVTSSQGYPGLWVNPGGHPTAPYHTKCLVLGSTTVTLALTFPAAATVYAANDGSGQKVLNLSAGSTVAQLVYHGSAGDYTTGAGTLQVVTRRQALGPSTSRKPRSTIRAASPMEI